MRSVMNHTTRITRITRDLERRSPSDAIARVSESVHDWSGGTKIGQLRTAAKEFIDTVLANATGLDGHLRALGDQLPVDLGGVTGQAV